LQFARDIYRTSTNCAPVSGPFRSRAGRFGTEDDVILDSLERHRQAQQPPAVLAGRQGELTSQYVQQRLFHAGLISEFNPRITDLTPYQNRRAVPIQGEPIFVTALRERC
jgi:hypothetical protein